MKSYFYVKKCYLGSIERNKNIVSTTLLGTQSNAIKYSTTTIIHHIFVRFVIFCLCVCASGKL